MDLKEFIKNFGEQFDETPIEAFHASTDFKQLEEWSSMTALVIIAMVDSSYHLKLTGEDIRSSQTIEDLFNTILTKKQ